MRNLSKIGRVLSRKYNTSIPREDYEYLCQPWLTKATEKTTLRQGVAIIEAKAQYYLNQSNGNKEIIKMALKQNGLMAKSLLNEVDMSVPKIAIIGSGLLTSFFLYGTAYGGGAAALFVPACVFCLLGSLDIYGDANEDRELYFRLMSIATSISDINGQGSSNNMSQIIKTY